MRAGQKRETDDNRLQVTFGSDLLRKEWKDWVRRFLILSDGRFPGSKIDFSQEML